ncbi:G-type lectin S-receptor-like serine/threonine-protein kinase CES101 isoform X2, partial [Fagus crenata]
MEPACSQRDTLVQGQQLKDGQYLSSASGNYRLGFFSGSGRKHHKPVWVKNRNTPIFDDSGVLTIGNDGCLKILHNGEEEIVQFSVQSISNTSTTLLDSGNFVMHELNLNGSIKQVLWQSFDYPTNTLLPGMKLGFNTKTGHNWSLTSWPNKEDPASGSFTLGMDPNNTNQLIIWWQGEIYWVSGLWPNFSFNLPHVLSNDVYYHFSYHSEENEKLTLKASGALLGMDMNGEKDILSCERASFLDGCLGKKNDKCFSGERFISRKGIMLQSGFKFNKRDKLTLSDCKAICVSYCSCSAYASKNDDETGCKIWSDHT